MLFHISEYICLKNSSLRSASSIETSASAPTGTELPTSSPIAFVGFPVALVAWSLCTPDATETQRCRTIHTWGHHQQLAMFSQTVRLREIPNGALRLIIAAAS